MPSTPHSLINYLREVIGAWKDDPRSDAELMARFTEFRDQTAFKVLVGRHGAMVWRTCRRILGNTPDAEDVFQSTFLVVTRKAGLFPVKSLAGWLHQVARRAALKADADARRRQDLERQMRTRMQGEAKEDTDRGEQSGVLDEELANLPEKLRVPLVLHFMEEKTQSEVARILGCSQSTVQKRLTRGEAIIRKRLEQRGLTLGIGSIASLLGSTSGAPAVPLRLIESTARAAVAFKADTLTGGTAEAAEKLLRALAVKRVVRAGWWLILACVGSLGIGGAGLTVWKMMYGDNSSAVVLAEPPATKMAPHEIVSPKATAKSNNERVDYFGDPLPEGALARIGTLRYGRTRPGSGYNGGESDVVFMPDGKTLVSSCGGDLYFWELSTGKELRRVGGVCGNKFAISPDGKILASSGEYWDLTADPPRRLEMKEKKPAGIEGDRVSVVFSADGETVAWTWATDKGGVVYLTDPSTGKVKNTLNDIDCGSAVAFSPDGKTMVTGGKRHAIALWDVATWTLRRRIDLVPGGGGRNLPVLLLAFIPDGGILVHFVLGSDPVCFLCTKKQLLLLDPVTGAKKKLPAGIAHGFFDRIGEWSFSRDGKMVAFTYSGIIGVWDVMTGQPIGPDGLFTRLAKLVFSSDGKKLATFASSTRHYLGIQQWNTDTGRLEKELGVPQEELWIRQFVDYDRSVEFLRRQPSWNLQRWDIETGKREKVEKWFPSCLEDAPSARCWFVSPDGRWQAWGFADSVALVDGATDKVVRRFPTQDPSHVKVTGDGQSVLVACRRADNPGAAVRRNDENLDWVEVWSTVTGERRMSESGAVAEDKVKWSRIISQDLSSDGRWLAAVVDRGVFGDYKDGSRAIGLVRLWEVASGKEVAVKTEARVIAWSPDGRLLAGGDGRGHVWVWDRLTGREVRHFTGHRRDITELVFSPDGQRLASSSVDSTALIWDLRGLSHSESREKDPLSADALWALLQNENPVEGCRAIRLLTQMPDVALPLLREHLIPVSLPDPQEMVKLLAQLDDESFEVRSRAYVELKKRGEAAEGAMRRALEEKPTVEVRRQLEELLRHISPSRSVALAMVRGVEVLERIATPAARHVLEELSRLPVKMLQAEEAKGVLRRLAKSAPAPVTVP